MPQASSITLNDGNSDRVFTPVSIGDKALFENRDNATSAAFGSLVLALDRAKPGRPTNKVSVRLSQPIEKTVDDVVVVRSIPRHFGETVIPDDMTAAERTSFATLVAAAYYNAIVKGYHTNLEPVW